MCGKAELRILFCLVIALGVRPFSSHAVTYDILSVASNRVQIKFSCTKAEGSRSASKQPLLFGFATSPSVTAVMSIGSAAPQATGSIPFTVLSKGWSGPSFLQWVSFYPFVYGTGGTGAFIETGTITISYGSSVVNVSSTQKPRVKNGVFYCPILPGLSKTARMEKPVIPFRSGLRMFINKDGIYQVRAVELKNRGVPLDRIASRLFKLYSGGGEVPFYISNNQRPTMQDDDVILFYGSSLRGANSFYTQYSNASAYWLTWENDRPGIRIGEESAAQRKDITQYQKNQYGTMDINAHDFLDTLHLEEDNDIRWLGTIYAVQDMADSSGAIDIDNWYWGFVGQSALTDFSIIVPSPTQSQAPGMTARLHIKLEGITTNTQVNPDHRLYIYLNDNTFGGRQQMAEWDGQTAFDFYSTIFPASLLTNGANKITFSRVPLGGSLQDSTADRSALNWIEIEYYRSYYAYNDKLKFKNSSLDTSGVYRFELKGFSSSSLELWDLTSHRILTGFDVVHETQAKTSSNTLVFYDSLSAVHSYLAQSVDQRLSPVEMALDTIRNDWERLAGADYIIVTVDSFAPAFSPLIAAYAAKGITVAIADISDVYNSFSSGVRDPESIRSLLRFLFSLSPLKPPRYLLLGGDTTHDLDKKRQNRNIIPTHLSRVPGWGPSSDDGYFTLVWGDDNFPDLFVGRFPAENRVEMKSLVDKSVGYLTQRSTGPWHDNLLLIGGRESDFTAFNDDAQSEVIGPKMNMYRLDADTASRFFREVGAAPQDIAGAINAGVYAVNFNGHGGGNVWSDNSFFGYSDLEKLYNGQWDKSGRLPFVFSFTCLTGFFESAFYRSLGEEFVRLPKGGCVGFFGASAYTSKKGNLIMNRILLDNAVNGKFESVGELLWLVKMNMLVRFGSEYLALVRQYNFLGDPGLPWALAPDSMDLSLSVSALGARDTLSIHGICAPVKTGKAKVAVGADLAAWNGYLWNVSADTFGGKIAVKDSLMTANGMVRAFAWNDSADLRGWAPFSKSKILFAGVTVSPPAPRFGDSVVISAVIDKPDTTHTVRAMLCLYALVPRYAKAPVFSGVSMSELQPGTWTTNTKLPLVFTGVVGEELLVKFRVVGERVSDTTATYAFPIQGRPDLLFTGQGLKLFWRGDSLALQCEILNGGNMASPPFSVSFYKGASGSQPFATFSVADSLLPGKTRLLSLALPDTSGTFTVRAVISPVASFDEISRDNNADTLEVAIVSGDLLQTGDTLCSAGTGLCISPVSTLSGKKRLFLFKDTIAETRPLRTESSWVPLRGDSVARFSIGARPPLSPTDSLSWIFRRPGFDSSPLLKRSAAGPPAKIAVVAYDSLLKSWRFAPCATDSGSRVCVMHSVKNGPFALGSLGDNTPPQVRVSVNGRDIIFLDYAAKDKPFNIFFSDASGIVPSSIRVQLNRRSLDSSLISGISPQSDVREISLTAYPPKQNAIDSLVIYAEDLAGNGMTKTLAYMPGEELNIKFFSCHPNPFTAKQDATGRTVQTIRFAFLITDAAKEASIVIYTIASRTVWQWQRTDGLIGYQEVEWDGKTSRGYRIANGTYYAKLTVKNDSKKVSTTIRIAKLEGY
jgi:hypothetical protein